MALWTKPEWCHLYGGCGICRYRCFTTGGDHICPHKRYEAEHSLGFVEAMLAELKGTPYESTWTTRREALLALTPSQRFLVDATIAEANALIRRYEEAFCRCPFELDACVCGARARLAALPKHTPVYS